MREQMKKDYNYLMWTDKIQGEDYVVIQLRGEYPMASFRMTKSECIEFIANLQETLEEL